MPLKSHKKPVPVVIERSDFQGLFDALKSQGYDVCGPTLKDGAVMLDHIEGTEDLPEGWIDRQKGGLYNIGRNRKNTFFSFVNGPQSWKRFLYPPEQLLLAGVRRGKKADINKPPLSQNKQAFLGVRSCELEAIKILDKVLLEGPYVDAGYVHRRHNTFIVAVNCTRAGGTCFCVSMDAGPRVKSGYDLLLTEISDGESHYFLTEAGSEKGEEILQDITHRDAREEEIEAAEKAVRHAASHMGRELNTEGLAEILERNFDNPRWEEVAKRCLSCGNCTMVCPTCFCSTMEDRTDVTGEKIERWRLWDSCHTVEFSYIHGGSIRTSTLARYRQWMTHKLAYWHGQFGTSGCVGCGRCITWCPVGIDITEEAQAIRASE